jgi:hypothetical protein
MTALRTLKALALAAAIAALGSACQPEQLRSVRRFNEQTELRQVACLDINVDGAVNAGDADAGEIPDVTGDGATTESDRSLLREVDFPVPDRAALDCDDGRGPNADWQVSAPPDLDCAAGERGVLFLAVGGGAVNLGNLENAAGARWMVENLSSELEDLGVPTQIASVAPGLNGTDPAQPNAERWAFLFLAQRFREQPCLGAVLLGDSHGGVLVTALAAQLETAGLSDRLWLTVLVDRATALYSGDTASIPQASPVFNVFLPPAPNEIRGSAIEQANVENWDASGATAPEHGEEGGELQSVNHSTIDNSAAVLEEVRRRVIAAVGSR